MKNMKLFLSENGVCSSTSNLLKLSNHFTITKSRSCIHDNILLQKNFPGLKSVVFPVLMLELFMLGTSCTCRNLKMVHAKPLQACSKGLYYRASGEMQCFLLEFGEILQR